MRTVLTTDVTAGAETTVTAPTPAALTIAWAAAGVGMAASSWVARLSEAARVCVAISKMSSSEACTMRRETSDGATPACCAIAASSEVRMAGVIASGLSPAAITSTRAV